MESTFTPKKTDVDMAVKSVKVKNESYSYAVFSDLHVNARRNPAHETMAQLTALIMDNPKAVKWDMIFFTGDFFDSCMSFAGNDVYTILHWISEFASWAVKNNVSVRVLRGTPSHDWNQPLLFSIIAKAYPDWDYKYHAKLEIDYIERLNAHVLYVPDEWRVDPLDTWAEVKELMASRGLKKVQYAMMHGFFDFQVPKHLNFTNHSSRSYLGIVERHIFCGHDHKPKRYKRITIPGSTNRISHGEEESKGYWVGVTKGKVDEITFIENHLAHKYLTIECTGLALDDAISRIKDTVAPIPDGSQIRITANSDDAIVPAMTEVRKMYPTIVFDTKLTNVTKIDEASKDVMEVKVDIVQLTEENFSEVILDPILNDSDEWMKPRLEKFKELAC